MQRLRTFLLSIVTRLLLRPAPPLVLDERKESLFRTFADVLMRDGGEVVAYTLPYPLHEFTRFLVREYPVLLHGTPNPDVRTLVPASQTDHSGKSITAVFATDDGIWPLYFATIDRSRYEGRTSMRNAAIVIGEPANGRRSYLFSLNREFHATAPFTSGYVLILPREPFEPTDTRPARFPEWASPTPVGAIARIAVSPSDFPFATQVAAHKRNEFFPLTWLLYRYRTR